MATHNLQVFPISSHAIKINLEIRVSYMFNFLMHDFCHFHIIKSINNEGTFTFPLSLVFVQDVRYCNKHFLLG